jgi:hypothetical protein
MERNQAVLTFKRLPHAIYVGYAALLACSPMTSATEVAVSMDLAQSSAIGWGNQVAFLLSFTAILVLFGILSKRNPGICSTKWLPLLLFSVAEVGILASAAALETRADFLFLLGAVLRGCGMSGLMLAWFEIIVDLMPNVRHSSVMLPISLFVASLFGFVVVAFAIDIGATTAFLTPRYCSRSRCSSSTAARRRSMRSGMRRQTRTSTP